MTLIKELIQPVPFKNLPTSYNPVTSPQKPFYFQKKQCKQDCVYATITDKNHLPPFVVQVDDAITNAGQLSMEVICPNGSDVQALTIEFDIQIFDGIPASALGFFANPYQGVNFNLAGQMANPSGITFNPTFSRYLIIDTATAQIYQYATNGSFAGLAFNVSAQCTNPTGIVWDGTNYYVLCDSSNTVFRYASNGTYTGFSFSISAQDTLWGGMTYNGTNLFIVGVGSDTVYEYTTGGSYTGNSFSVNQGGFTVAGGIAHDPANDTFWMTDVVSGVIAQFDSSGLSTGAFIDVSPQDSNMRGITIQGTDIVTVGASTDRAYQYNAFMSSLANMYFYIIDINQLFFFDGVTIGPSPQPDGTVFFFPANSYWIFNNGVIEVTSSSGINLYDDGTCKFAYFNGASAFPDINCGLKQMRIISTVEHYYSELIDVKDFDVDNHKYHKLTLSSDCNIGDVPYENIAYSPIFYFEGNPLVGEPEYSVEEEKEEDGLGVERSIYKKMSKLFVIDTQEIPEYIIDFLIFATLHQEANIEFPFLTDNGNIRNTVYEGIRCIDTDNFEAENSWIETGCYGQVTLKMALTNAIIKTSCC